MLYVHLMHYCQVTNVAIPCILLIEQKDTVLDVQSTKSYNTLP